MRERWTHFWFEPTAPTNLGMCRALFFGAFFLFYLAQDFSAWGEVSRDFWMPTWFFKTLHLFVLPAVVLDPMQAVWKLALALSCLGLFTRLSTALSFMLGFYLLGLPHSLGKISHYDGLVVVVLGVMALSRCGDGFSLDRLIQAGRAGTRSYRLTPASGEYTWPVRVVWLMFALIFFAAGAAKLRYSGSEWFLSDSFAIMLIQARYRTDDVSPLTTWGLHLAQFGWLCRVLAAATVALEFGYPLALVSRRARWVIVPAVLSMQIGIRLIVGPSFNQFIICNLFWVRWDRLTASMRERFAHA